jgi:glycerol-3-phosphate acyltransferase PlsY
LAIHLEASLLCVLVFLVVLLLTNYVSLSSLAAGFTFPLSVIFVFQVSVKSIIIYGMCICVLIMVTHQKNIERLLKGSESKVNLFKRKESKRVV